MTAARVRVDDAEAGNLPAISVKTGRPCTTPVAIRLRVDRVFTAVVALEARRVATRRVMKRVLLVLLALILAALLSIFTGARGVGLIAAALGALLYVALVVIGDRRWVGARAVATEGEVELTRVHEGFARAVDEQYGR